MSEEFPNMNDVVVQAFIDPLPEVELIIKAALYLTIQDFGGIEKFAQKADVPFDELYDSVISNRLPPQATLRKVWPLCETTIETVFNTHAESATEDYIRTFFEKNNFELREDLATCVEEALANFEVSATKSSNETIANVLNLIANFLNSDDNTSDDDILQR